MMSLQAERLPQHLRRAVVDQSGLRVESVLLLLLLLVGPWLQ